MNPGYHRDNDQWLYATKGGALYVVTEPDAVEPVWSKTDPILSEDSVPATPDAEDLALFERCRVGYGIPA